MKILGERVEIRPLNSFQLQLYIENPKDLSKLLSLTEALVPLDDHMKKVYHLKAKRIEETPSSLLYNTYFLIILREERIAIGTIGLKGSPDEEGLVEVGYAIQEAYQNKGYMREALKLFVAWLMKIEEISGVNACTSIVNIPSHKVLMASGFERVYKNCDMIIWRFTSI